MALSDSEPTITPFDEFYRRAQSVDHEEFRRRPGTKVRNRDAFEEQRRHLLSLYHGINASHSFVDSQGQIFDCIPIEQQPALTRTGAALATPPVVPAPGGAPAQTSEAGMPLHPNKRDRFGNVMSCPPGTVAVRRVTLEELSRFETLGHFLRKSPRSTQAAMVPPAAPEAPQPPHEYAHAGQTVDNLGGHGFLNIWAPAITGDETFSLSQHWYAAEGPSGTQTAEVGWQVFPEKYRHAHPVLFTYWTPDGYKTGSYSNDAGDFVQYSPNCPVGIALDDVSVLGGAQAEIEVCYFLSGGNWWLFVNGVGTAHAVGYYPATKYQGGPLATKATSIDYGGETVGTTAYPAMGSGEFASAGAGKAAYQRDIYYFTPAGASQQADLQAAQQWPASYTIEVHQSNAWGEYFWFGGPGGAPEPST
jgi:hypothetical protein